MVNKVTAEVKILHKNQDAANNRKGEKPVRSRFLRSGGLIAALLTFALLATACGSDSGDTESTSAAVQSADGGFTVAIPEGAAGEGVEISVELLADGDLPAELRGPDTVVVGYEMSPDGAEFTEPLSIEFRIDPAELGLDLSAGEVPLGLLLTRGDTDEFEAIGGVISRDGTMVVAQASVEHFSPAFLVLSATAVVALEPDDLKLNVGEEALVKVVAGDSRGGARLPLNDIDEFSFNEFRLSSKDPFSAREGPGPHDVVVSCSEKTNGVVQDAFVVRVETMLQLTNLAILDDPSMAILFGLNLFGNFPSVPSFKLAGTGTCSGDPVEETVEAPPPSVIEQATCQVGSGTPPTADQGAIDAAADDVAERARLASTVTYAGYRSGSHIFTMGVAGDGETVATDPQTKWYSPRFVVNHDENNMPDPGGAFTVDVGWDNDGLPEIDVLDSSFRPIQGTDGSLVWLDQSTLEVTVSSPEIDSIEVNTLKIELTARVTDLDGVTLASLQGDGCWSP